MGNGIEEEKLRATAVFANPMLQNEQRVNIYKIGYFFNFDNYENDVGVIMVG